MKRCVFSGFSVLVAAAAVSLGAGLANAPAVQAQTLEANGKNTPSLAVYGSVHALVNDQRAIRSYGRSKNTPSLAEAGSVYDLVNSQREVRDKK